MNKTTDSEPMDAAERQAQPVVVCYETHQLPSIDKAFYEQVHRSLTKVDEVLIPPRDARCFEVPQGHVFRIESVEGPQVGDLNLWRLGNLRERFYSGKTRQLQASHVSTYDRLWSSMPYLSPLATITHDSLAWYGIDQDGGSVHDVIGTRCDPYTNALLRGVDYHYCCHSNLTRALADYQDMPLHEAEMYVHDVMNVFMCTGFTLDTHQYFMKASPVRPGDYIEFFAEVALLGALSACPGGDCGSTHSDDATRCYPLKVSIHSVAEEVLEKWQPVTQQQYNRTHGL